MKKKEKRMLLVLILISALIIGVIYFATRPKVNNEEVKEENKVVEEFVQVLEDGTKLNTSTKLGEMKEINGLKIGNIQLTNNGSKTELIADVTNGTQTDKKAMLIKVILYDKTGKEIATLAGRISPIKAGQTMQFSTSAMIDYANAYDFKIVEDN